MNRHYHTIYPQLFVIILIPWYYNSQLAIVIRNIILLLSKKCLENYNHSVHPVVQKILWISISSSYFPFFSLLHLLLLFSSLHASTSYSMCKMLNQPTSCRAPSIANWPRRKMSSSRETAIIRTERKYSIYPSSPPFFFFYLAKSFFVCKVRRAHEVYGSSRAVMPGCIALSGLIVLRAGIR